MVLAGIGQFAHRIRIPSVFAGGKNNQNPRQQKLTNKIFFCANAIFTIGPWWNATLHHLGLGAASLQAKLRARFCRSKIFMAIAH